MFGSPFERDAVARALYRRATSDTPPLDRVGELAGVTIPASDIRSDPRFVELGGRLTRRPDLDRVPVLTPADLAAIKQGTIVRTPDEFAARASPHRGPVLRGVLGRSSRAPMARHRR